MLPSDLLKDKEFAPFSEGERLNDFDFDGDVEPEVLANHLLDNMELHGGVGLTASQIGINARVFAFKENTGSELIDMVAFNPQIVSYSEENALESEGCLSYPDEYIDIERPVSVVVKYEDEGKKVHKVKLEGLSARVFQHEYDHMNGIDFTQRSINSSKELTLK